MKNKWESDCCEAPHDDRFQFDDFMSNEPLGICSQCKQHITFHKIQGENNNE